MKSLDLFSKPVELHFNRETHHSTMCGQFISVIVIAFMCFVLVVDTITLVSYDGDTINSYSEVLDDDQVDKVTLDQTNYLPSISFANLTSTSGGRISYD